MTAHGRAGVGLDVGDSLTLYVDHLAAFGVAPRTVDTYRSAIRCYVKRFLAGVMPGEMTEHDVNAFYRRMIIEGSADGDPLNRNTVRKVHAIMRGGFRWLKTEGFISVNVMLDIKPPKPEDTETRSLDDAELKKLTTAIDEIMGRDPQTAYDRSLWIAAWASLLMLYTGMRAGEVCGIRKSCTIADTQTFRIIYKIGESTFKGVRQEPPKDRQQRNIRVSSAIFERMESAEKTLASMQRKSIDTLGDYYLVSENGRPLRPSTLDDYFALLREYVGLPDDVKPHTLRHTHATYLIAAGVDIRTVAERLGHADPSITMRIYAHAIKARDAEAAVAIEDVYERIGSGRKKS